MKFFTFILLSFFCPLAAQQSAPFDSLKLRDVKDFFADDYGNVYLYKNKDFSFTKYDSLGTQIGKLMLTLPVKIQTLQNPLNIPSFSENTQELKFYDQNLNEIQTVKFRQKFGFVKMAYAEDLQQIWLLEESAKRLIQYSFRHDRVINAYPFDLDLDNIKDLLVYDNIAYILTENQLQIFNFRLGKLLSLPVQDARKLRRENTHILVLGKNSIQQLEENTLKTVFRADKAQIVDKNSAAYFEIRANKLYLYPINY